MFIPLFGVLYTEDEVRQCTLKIVPVDLFTEGVMIRMWTEIYLCVPGHEDREIATVLTKSEELRIRAELVKEKGMIWSRDQGR